MMELWRIRCGSSLASHFTVKAQFDHASSEQNRYGQAAASSVLEICQKMSRLKNDPNGDDESGKGVSAEKMTKKRWAT